MKDNCNKKLNNFLKKFTIDYKNKHYNHRNCYINISAACLVYIEMLNIFTLPLIIESYIESHKNNVNVNNKLLLSSALINSIMINSAILGTISFFILKKCTKEGLITGLSPTSIIMISFILFPIITTLFSTIMVAILYKARESCEEKYKDLFITFDIHFTNPATGLIMAIAVLVGTTQDILEKRKNQQDTHSYEYSYEYSKCYK